MPFYQMGFPVFSMLGNTGKVSVGYKGSGQTVNEIANLLNKEVHS
jgi:nitrogenase molybdenum-iron protein alpha/beta subunit